MKNLIYLLLVALLLVGCGDDGDTVYVDKFVLVEDYKDGSLITLWPVRGTLSKVVLFELNDDMDTISSKELSVGSGEVKSDTEIRLTRGNYSSDYILVRADYGDGSESQSPSIYQYVFLPQGKAYTGSMCSSLLQFRIGALLKEGYPYDFSETKADKEFSKVYGECTRYTSEIKEMNDMLFDLITRGDTVDYMAKIHDFMEDFADGTLDDSLAQAEQGDHILKNIFTGRYGRYNVSDNFKALDSIAQKLLGFRCDSLGERVTVTNKHSAYAGEVLVCDDRWRGVSKPLYPRIMDDFEKDFGACAEFDKAYVRLGYVKCTADSICYRCEDGQWADAYFNDKLSYYYYPCTDSIVGDTLFHKDTIAVCSKSRNYPYKTSWNLYKVDSIRYELGPCTDSLLWQTKVGANGKTYACVKDAYYHGNMWDEDKPSYEAVRIGGICEYPRDYHKVILVDTTYFACSGSALDKCMGCGVYEEVTKESAEWYLYYMSLEEVKVCNQESDGDIAYYAEKDRCILCRYSEGREAFLWEAAGYDSENALCNDLRAELKN